MPNFRHRVRESIFSGMKKRLLQVLALYAPGVATLRVRLHRWRGVKMGKGVRIGADALIETSFPHWVSIGNGVQIGIRTTIIAHYDALPVTGDKYEDGAHVSVRIEDEANIGPGVIILPNVTVGRGAVVAAGSVVSRSVPPLTMVRGNPARPVARCGIPLLYETPLKEFLRSLKPIEDTKS